MSQPWKNAIKAGLASIPFLFLIDMILVVVFSNCTEWLLLLFSVFLGSFLIGLFVYARTRVRELDARLEYLSRRLDKWESEDTLNKSMR